MGDDELKRVAMERDLVNERFRLMSKAMKEGMWDWDMRTDVAWYSDAVYSVFGLDPAETPTFERWTTFVHPDDRDRVVSGFRAVVEKGEPEWSDEYRFVCPDGRILEIWDRGYVMFDETKRPYRMVGVVMDVTEQRALERKVRHAQKMEAVGQLAGGIAHDFNNMMQAAKLELAMLRATPDASPKLLGHANEIGAVLDRTASLTRQLMLFGRREAMRHEVIDLNAKVTDLARMLQRVLGGQIVLDLELGNGAHFVKADSSMLDQVIINLAVNARDAMPRGGRLSITTWRAGGNVCLDIRDSGTGIAPDILPYIFDPFFTTKASEGTGLGLATAHGIVEQHRGWIEVDSKLDIGTTFRVFLPAYEGTARTPDPVAQTATTRGKETVLLVEDDDAVRRAMSNLLESSGYTVLAADCAPSALAKWDQAADSIDMVITDLAMPGGMNGRELAATLSSKRSGLKIMIVTGHRELDTPSAEFQVLHKPIEAESLLSTVRACLDR